MSKTYATFEIVLITGLVKLVEQMIKILGKHMMKYHL